MFKLIHIYTFCLILYRNLFLDRNSWMPQMITITVKYVYFEIVEIKVSVEISIYLYLTSLTPLAEIRR